MIVTAPASTANLGPGFDCLALALELRFELATEDGPGRRPVDDTHPARVASLEAGGHGPLWWRSSIPAGRGLGFSGAARAAGVVCGLVQRHGTRSWDPEEAAALVARLEGHPENGAASLRGGFVVAAADRVLSVPVHPDLDVEVVVWTPDRTTSTDRSRRRLPASVPFEDAVANVGRAALLVAALGTGDREAIGVAVADRLHQPARLADDPDAVAVMEAAVGAGALGAWLSGSGPSVAALVERARGEAVAAAVVAPGRVRRLALATAGTVLA